jgi:hypothetical protein
MSDEVFCEVCRKRGYRRLMRHCPEGWFYGEFINDADPRTGPYVLTVCSKACSEAFWVVGPGRLNTSPPYILHRKANRDVEEIEEEDGSSKEEESSKEGPPTRRRRHPGPRPN